MVRGFSSPVASVAYIVAMGLLGMHLSHGAFSMFFSLGLIHPKYRAALRSITYALMFLVVLGNSAVATLLVPALSDRRVHAPDDFGPLGATAALLTGSGALAVGVGACNGCRGVTGAPGAAIVAAIRGRSAGGVPVPEP